MIDRSKASLSWVGRLCARLTVVFCLVAFGFGGAVERGLAAHAGFGSALSLAVSFDGAGDTAGGDFDKAAEVVDHGCHGCAAIPQPLPHGASIPVAFGEQLAWTAVPSADGREPLIDLPPPRA